MEAGVAVYACMMKGDSDQDAVWIAEKITSLRVFSDEDGKMNKSLLDTGGSCLVVSQFTLAADTKKGRRPSYMEAMGPPEAKKLVARLAGEIMALGAERANRRFRSGHANRARLRRPGEHLARQQHAQVDLAV